MTLFMLAPSHSTFHEKIPRLRRISTLIDGN
jgi:hypothetical protein